LIAILIAVAANHASNNVKKNAAAGNLGGAAPGAKYSLGQSAKTGGFNITV
jgi:hypothetical protein